jgi:predicted AlkP superfamily pyrophosphatase or phosphodiesterase
MIRFARLFVFGVLVISALTAAAAPRAEHVFVISIDGGHPDMLLQSKMPVLHKLAGEGAHTWWARTINPPLTLPAHTSMLTGVGPEKHQVNWNDWRPTNGVVRVPTVFAAARNAGFSTAMIVAKEKFRHLVQPNTVDFFNYDAANSTIILKSDSGDSVKRKEGTVRASVVASHAAACILKQKPNLCFIHFTEADTFGHEFGWGSPEQLKALADVDAGLKVIVDAIRKAGIARKSIILISADHGGQGRGHSKGTPDDIRIPWIAWGKGVKRQFEITKAVYTCDTAATALWLLGLAPVAAIEGRAASTAWVTN